MSIGFLCFYPHLLRQQAPKMTSYQHKQPISISTRIWLHWVFSWVQIVILEAGVPCSRNPSLRDFQNSSTWQALNSISKRFQMIGFVWSHPMWRSWTLTWLPSQLQLSLLRYLDVSNTLKSIWSTLKKAIDVSGRMRHFNHFLDHFRRSGWSMYPSQTWRTVCMSTYHRICSTPPLNIRSIIGSINLSGLWTACTEIIDNLCRLRSIMQLLRGRSLGPVVKKLIRAVWIWILISQHVTRMMIRLDVRPTATHE